MQFYKRLGYGRFLRTRFADKINVTEQDANEYYNKNLMQFKVPEQVRVSHILIKPDSSDPNVDPDEAKATAEAKAQDILKRIKEGGEGSDFATLAKANSACPSGAKGGDLDFGRKGAWVPPFEKAAFSLKIGQVSDVVETRFGYHIIKATDRKDAAVTTFEQARERIMGMLKSKKYNELVIEYIDSLKAGANIIYSDAALGEENKARAVWPGKVPAK